MLTLRKLKEIVEMPEPGVRVPTYKQLREREISVCSKKIQGENEAEIIVYRNGYVVYRIGNRATVFPINLVDNYCYSSVTDMPQDLMEISDSYFQDEVWYMLLILIGEDRLQHNLYCRDHEHCISLDALPKDYEDYIEAKSEQVDIEDQIVSKEEAEELMRSLSPKQRKALGLRIWGQQPRQVIAEELGVKSKSAVTNLITRALDHMRKSMGVDCVSNK